MGSIRDAGIDYIRYPKDIPGVEEVPRIDSKDNKENRGFNHHATARLLCPRRIRDEFDADRDTFCRNVKDGKCKIKHNDYPSFLYPDDKYNPEALDENLLRGLFLVSVGNLCCLYLHS